MKMDVRDKSGHGGSGESNSGEISIIWRNTLMHSQNT